MKQFSFMNFKFTYRSSWGEYYESNSELIQLWSDLENTFISHKHCTSNFKKLLIDVSCLSDGLWCEPIWKTANDKMA